MKIHLTVITLMAGLLAMLNLPARAQDKPAPPPQPSGQPDRPDKPDTPPPPPPSHERPRGDMTPVREPDRVLEKPVAYLGVLTGPVSRELRAQFGLADGFGLQVVEVMPDSPARAAGLKEHDVLVTFEDQKLVNMEQLQTLVRSRKKDETVNLTVITSGQQKQVGVKIGERLVKVEDERSRNGFMPMMPPWSGGPFSRGGGTEEWRERIEHFQRQMREYQEQVQKWAREGREGTMPMPPAFEMPREGRDGWRGHEEKRPEMHRRDHGPGMPREGEGRRMDGPRDMPPPSRGGQGETHRSERREFHESASITRSDDSGIYRLSKDGDRAVFSVKPKEGEAREWPVNSEEERAAVPEPFRTKLREMEQIRSSVREDEARAPEPSGGRRGE